MNEFTISDLLDADFERLYDVSDATTFVKDFIEMIRVILARKQSARVAIMRSDFSANNGDVASYPTQDQLLLWSDERWDPIFYKPEYVVDVVGELQAEPSEEVLNKIEDVIANWKSWKEKCRQGCKRGVRGFFKNQYQMWLHRKEKEPDIGFPLQSIYSAGIALFIRKRLGTSDDFCKLVLPSTDDAQA